MREFPIFCSVDLVPIVCKLHCHEFHDVSPGSASGNGTIFPFEAEIPVTLKAGKNEIALLSMTVGLQGLTTNG